MSFGAAFRNFWHDLTSYDRHSDYDSPYRSGRHVPLNRQSTLTSVATASDSRNELTSTYDENDPAGYMGAGMTSPSQAALTGSNGSGPYSPGLRSMNARRSRDDGFETVNNAGEIPMQSFAEGGPPAPPVGHSWKRIDRWCDENYPELFDQLCEGCTINDINELEHMLDASLPQDLRESLAIHDGQERGGNPTGIIFSAMLMDCEEIVQERETWYRVNQQYLAENNVIKPSVPTKAFGGSNQASSSRSTPSSPSGSQQSTWRQDLLSRQDSIPAGAIQRAYAHPAWIPLVRDWGGNNIAVDLAPGPTGTWGQVIIFGRDYDTKYVVARSWGAFLAMFADDLNSGKWFIDDDSFELKLREFKTTRVEPSYFDILRWRMDQKHGRTAKANAKRKSMRPMAGGAGSPGGSPYTSPVDGNGESRGRPLQRLSNPSPLSSPARPGYNKASPLARVTEEGAAPQSTVVTNGAKPSKLVEVDTPRPSDEDQVPKLPAEGNPTLKEDSPLQDESPTAEDKPDDNAQMKTIEI